MASFSRIAIFNREGNLDFNFLTGWEPAIAIVAKLNPDNPAFKGRRGSVAIFKQFAPFDEPTWIQSARLYWNSPQILVLPREPVQGERVLWSGTCTPNWQIFPWVLEVWRVEGLPVLEPGAVDLSLVESRLETLETGVNLLGQSQLQQNLALESLESQIEAIAQSQAQIAAAIAGLLPPSP